MDHLRYSSTGLDHGLQVKKLSTPVNGIDCNGTKKQLKEDSFLESPEDFVSDMGEIAPDRRRESSKNQDLIRMAIRVLDRALFLDEIRSGEFKSHDSDGLDLPDSDIYTTLESKTSYSQILVDREDLVFCRQVLVSQRDHPISDFSERVDCFQDDVKVYLMSEYGESSKLCRHNSSCLSKLDPTDSSAKNLFAKNLFNRKLSCPRCYSWNDDYWSRRRGPSCLESSQAQKLYQCSSYSANMSRKSSLKERVPDCLECFQGTDHPSTPSYEVNGCNVSNKKGFGRSKSYGEVNCHKIGSFRHIKSPSVSNEKKYSRFPSNTNLKKHARSRDHRCASSSTAEDFGEDTLIEDGDSRFFTVVEQPRDHRAFCSLGDLSAMEAPAAKSSDNNLDSDQSKPRRNRAGSCNRSDYNFSKGICTPNDVYDSYDFSLNMAPLFSKFAYASNSCQNDETTKNIEGEVVNNTLSHIAAIDEFASISEVLVASNIFGKSVSLEFVQRLVDQTHDWDFDIFEFEKRAGRNTLAVIGFCIFERNGIFSAFDLDRHTVWSYLSNLQDCYLGIAYHNALHAADVGLSLSYMFQKCGLYDHCSDLMRFAALFAALAHDVGHPGYTNTFLVKISHPLAICYNDKSPLEMMHASVAFQLLKQPGANMLEKLSVDEFTAFRQAVIRLVLATDNSEHDSVLQRVSKVSETMKAANASQGNCCVSEIENFCILEGALHAADISTSCKPWNVYKQWTDRLCEEFFRQGDTEKALGLNVQPFMNRKAPLPLERMQSGFMSAIVQPIFNSLHSVPGVDFSLALKGLKSNQAVWDAMSEE